MEKHSPAQITAAQWLEFHTPVTEFIDATAMQAGPINNLQDFEALMAQYGKVDYFTMEPFWQLVMHSQFAVGQYDQFAHALRRAAAAQHADSDMVEESLRMFRQMFFNQADSLDSICEAIRRAAEDKEHADKVSVLCLPCGAGKSTALTKLIYDVIQRDDGQGLIIVTDSVERMRKYWEKDSGNPHFDELLLRFISAHQQAVAVVTSDNIRAAMAQQHYAPVVVVSTQRYFSWHKEDVQRLLQWEGGTRPLIIFDEMPYLSQIHDVTPETLDRIATRLRMGSEATSEESRNEKRKMVTYWERIRAALLDKLEKLEDAAISGYFCAAQPDEEWEQFAAYVYAHAGQINTQNESVTTMVEDVQELLSNWGVYACRSSAQAGSYESKFAVYRDFRDLVTDLDAKVIVLDGTADISPMYREDYIHMGPRRQFVRSMSYLTIKLCDVDTSEKALREGKGQIQKMIHSYLQAATQKDPDLVVFTRKRAEAAFHRLGMDMDHTGHFNNIKGLNSYSQSTNIAQVGLNRLPPVNYYVMDLARDEEARQRLTEATSTEEMTEAVRLVSEAAEFNVQTMTGAVLADIEQNMFRSAIRNADNCSPVTYYLFFAHEHYRELIDAIRDRYEALGAKVEIEDRECVEKYAPNDSVQKRLETIQAWYDQWDGEPIKRSFVLKMLGMTAKEFENTLRLRPGSRTVLLIMEAGQTARRAGHKRGWLKKP